MRNQIYLDSSELHLHTEEGLIKGRADAGKFDALQDVMLRIRPPFEERFEDWKVSSPETFRGRHDPGRALVFEHKSLTTPVVVDLGFFGHRATPELLEALGRHFTVEEHEHG